MFRWFGLYQVSIWFIRRLLFSWVRTEVFPKGLKDLNIDPEKPICYVLESRSMADVMVLDQACLNAHLPRPIHKINQGSLKEDTSVSFLSRAEGKLFKKDRMRGKPPRLNSLMESLESDKNQDIQIVLIAVLWGRSPDRDDSFWKVLFSDNWSAPNAVHKLFMILLHGRHTSIHFSEPISLRHLADEDTEHERKVRKLTRVLRVHFRRQRVSFRGPDLSHRRTLVNGLLTTPAVKEAIASECIKKNIDQRKAEAIARNYADEIAADYSHAVIRALHITLTWLWNKLYDGVEVYNLDKLTKVAQGNEIIYVPCHKSHIDYLLMSYVLYCNGLVPPHIAAGINLNMPVLGAILRRGGAFFMRRSFNGNRLYSTVFTEYLFSMFSKGFSIEYFIEGGRSRTGRLLQPRTGMLSMTVKSYLRNSRRPIVFVPVYVGYEKMFEGGSYISEMKGKQKKKESLLGLLKSLRKIKSNFGKVHVNFSTPIPLNDLLTEHCVGWQEQTYTEDSDTKWLPSAVASLSNQIVCNINKATVINPITLLSLILLSTDKHSMDERTLEQQINFYLKLARNVGYSQEMEIVDMNGKEVIAYCEKMQILNRQEHPLGDLLYVEEQTALLMTYFRNNVIHLFALPSLIACFVVNSRSITIERLIRFCRVLYPFLKSELFLHWENEDLSGVIRNTVDIMLDANIIEKVGGTHRLHCPDSGSLEYVKLSVLASALRQTLERYYMTIALLLKEGSKTIKPRDLEVLSHLMAQRMSILHECNAPEFFDKAVFKNFIATLRKNKLVWTSEEGLLEFDRRMEEISKEARHILNDDVRQSIMQVTNINAGAKGKVVNLA